MSEQVNTVPDENEMMTDEAVTNKVINLVLAIKNGPRALQMYMDMCAKCGTCASVCPVYYGKSDKKYNPAERSDLIRRIYKRHGSFAGRLWSKVSRSHEFEAEDIDRWAEMFYECTGCRRCAQHCPFGIDNSVITRKGRAIVDALGKTPPFLLRIIDTSLETGNTDGANEAALKEVARFLEEEMLEETGVEVKIPVDIEGAEFFFVPPSGDVLVNPEAIMGTAKVLHTLGKSWTMSSRCFDGANYGLFTGDDASMKADNKRYVEEAKRLKCKTLMMGECGHAHRIMKFMREKGKWWGELPFEVSNIMQFTADAIQKGQLEFDKSKNPDPVTYHDPCNFAKSCGITEEPRIIMRACCADYRDMTPSGTDNWCCGGGGGLSAMDSILEYRMEISGTKKVEQIKATGAKYVAAACSNCKRQLSQMAEHHFPDVRTGGVHDLVSNALLLPGQMEAGAIAGAGVHATANVSAAADVPAEASGGTSE
jgi:Fe-S oxidoreductase